LDENLIRHTAKILPENVSAEIEFFKNRSLEKVPVRVDAEGHLHVRYRDLAEPRRVKGVEGFAQADENIAHLGSML
jgi:hypothetical protein